MLKHCDAAGCTIGRKKLVRPLMNEAILEVTRFSQHTSTRFPFLCEASAETKDEHTGQARAKVLTGGPSSR